MDEDLKINMARAVDAVRDNIETPVWTPLEALLPIEWCCGFMFMGSTTAKIMPVGMIAPAPDEDRSWWSERTIFSYKHGITRRYLHIGDDLNCYAEIRAGEDEYCWRQFSVELSIERAFEDIEALGGERATAYDAEFIRGRNERLVAAGFNVVC